MQTDHEHAHGIAPEGDLDLELPQPPPRRVTATTDSDDEDSPSNQSINRDDDSADSESDGEGGATLGGELGEDPANLPPGQSEASPVEHSPCAAYLKRPSAENGFRASSHAYWRIEDESSDGIQVEGSPFTTVTFVGPTTELHLHQLHPHH